MSKKALLDFVADSRRTTIYHEQDGKTFIETRQDVAPIIKAAKEIQELPKNKEMTLVRLIPEAVLNRSYIEGWFHDDKAWRRWANGPEGKMYDTWGRGTV